MIPFIHSITMMSVKSTIKIRYISIGLRVLDWDMQEGNKMAISKSNTRNRIITKKNLVEKEVLFLVIPLNPHSNLAFFSKLGLGIWATNGIDKVRKVTKNKVVIKKEENINF